MKVYLFILAFLFCSSSFPAKSYADNSYFAQVVDSGTFLYTQDKTIICELPQTYFVNITSYRDGYYTASYNNIKGYILASSVKVIKGVPKSPYLTDATFRLFASDYNDLKASPSILSRTYTTLPINQNITYIAKAYGDELIKNRGKTWYYCKYEANGESYNGYVYAGLCDSLNITYNTEPVQYITNPFVNTSSYYKQYLNSTAGKELLISCICIVSCVFAALIFLPYFLKFKKGKRKPSPIISIEDGKV